MATMPPAPPPGNGPMPPRGGAPPMDGPPPDDGAPNDLRDRIISQIPEPTKGKYNPKAVQRVADELADTWEALSEFIPEMPPLPEGLVPEGYTGEGKLPEAIVFAFTLILSLASEALAGAGEAEAAKRYEVDIGELVDDMALNKVASQLALLAKDKRFRKVVEEQMGPDADGESEEMEKPKGGAPPIPKGVAGAL